MVTNYVGGRGDSSSYLFQTKERKINMYNYLKDCRCGGCKAERAREEADKAKGPTSRVLTREMFLRGLPCSTYRSQFSEMFPEGSVEVTLELALSQLNAWPWDWAGEHLLSYSAWQEYYDLSDAASRRYSEQIQPYTMLSREAGDKAWSAHDEAYNAAIAAGKTYEEAYQAGDAAKRRVRGVATAAVQAARKEAGDQLEVARATAFVELFLKDEAAYTEQYKDAPPVEEPHDYDEDYEDNYYDDENYGDY